MTDTMMLGGSERGDLRRADRRHRQRGAAVIVSPGVAPAPIEPVLAKLKNVKPAGAEKWMALCPAHGDRARSLSLRLGKDGRVLMHCHAGCTVAAIMTVLGLQMTDLFAPTDRPTNAASVEKAPGVETRE